MADAVPQQHYAAPAAVAHVKEERYIQQTPIWVVVVRGFQVLLGFIILVMAGWLIHGYAMAANGFALACGLFTWIVVAYELISEKVPSAQGAYEIWAILTLDFVMAIFWLASLGANAAQRATFTVPVNIESCYNDGSAISSNHCTISGARLAKRAVADQGGLAMMSAIAGLSALVWLLFVATLVFHGHTFRLWHQEHKKPSADNATVEMKAQGTPMLAGQPEAQQAIHPQYTDQQQYQSQLYPQQPPQPQQGAYPQQTAAAAAAAVYPAQHQQQQQELPGAQPQQQQQPYAAYPDPAQYQQQPAQQQQPYSPHGTPAPGQAYYPPQQQQQPAYSPHGTPAPGQAYYPPQQPHEKQ